MPGVQRASAGRRLLPGPAGLDAGRIETPGTRARRAAALWLVQMGKAAKFVWRVIRLRGVSRARWVADYENEEQKCKT